MITIDKSVPSTVDEFLSRQGGIGSTVMEGYDPHQSDRFIILDPATANSGQELKLRVRLALGQTFDECVADEVNDRRVHLKALQSICSKFDPSFDAEAVFVSMAMDGSCLTTSRPIFTLTTSSHMKLVDQTITASGATGLHGLENGFLGFDYGLDFLYTELRSLDGRTRTVISPSAELDPKIGAAILAASPAERPLVNRTLNLLSEVISISQHDWVHHLLPYYNLHFLGDRYRWPDLGPAKNLAIKSSISQALEDLRDFESDRQFTSGMDDYPTVGELHAEVLNRAVWADAFANDPGLKERVIRKFQEFVDSLPETKNALSPFLGKNARDAVQYLAWIGLYQLDQILDIDSEVGISTDDSIKIDLSPLELSEVETSALMERSMCAGNPRSRFPDEAAKSERFARSIELAFKYMNSARLYGLEYFEALVPTFLAPDGHYVPDLTGHALRTKTVNRVA